MNWKHNCYARNEQEAGRIYFLGSVYTSSDSRFSAPSSFYVVIYIIQDSPAVVMRW